MHVKFSILSPSALSCAYPRLSSFYYRHFICFSHYTEVNWHLHTYVHRKLGDCSYLNACRHLKSCKFVHYEIDDSLQNIEAISRELVENCGPSYQGYASKYGCQWINCDVRDILSPARGDLLGKFSVVMADPPWDIHMVLPYGTMSDEEMLGMNIQCLQTDGILLLWVTVRTRAFIDTL